MLQLVMILEAINALIGIIVNLQGSQLLGWPVAYWNSIFFIAFFAGFLAIYLNSEKIKKDIYEQIKKEIEEIRDIKPQEGSLNNVTQQDRILIMSWAQQMIFEHGHQDLNGLLADRASGVKLNELMTRNCSKCGIPRNQQSGR